MDDGGVTDGVGCLTLAMGMTTERKAARYSASPSGGLRPPDHAMFTLKPSPGPLPHCTLSSRNYKYIYIYLLNIYIENLTGSFGSFFLLVNFFLPSVYY